MKICEVTERLGSDLPPNSVDRAAKVIRGVKVLGLESRNSGRVLGLDQREFGDAVGKPYGYDEAAVKAAIPLYEGCAVNVDHPASEMDATGRRVIKGGRGVMERFGRLKNVRFDKGLVADLEYLESHPAAQTILETAERMPEQIAMSHHATWRYELRGGRAVATEARSVHSVDLIGERPGTTSTLFESAAKEVQVKKVREVMEAAADKAPLRTFLATVIEMDAPMADMPMEAPPAESTGDDQVLSAFQAMVAAVLADSSLDLKGKLAKIKDIVTAHDKLTAKPEAKPSSEEKPSDDEKDAAESLAALRATVERERSVRSTLETRGVRASEVQIRACVALESDADRDVYVNELAASSQARPRSSAPSSSRKVDDEYTPDPKKFAARIR